MWNNKLIMGGCCNEPWCGERDDGWILRRAKSGCHRQLLYTWEMLLSSLCMVKWPDTVTHTLWFFWLQDYKRSLTWKWNDTISISRMDKTESVQAPLHSSVFHRTSSLQINTGSRGRHTPSKGDYVSTHSCTSGRETNPKIKKFCYTKFIVTT